MDESLMNRITRLFSDSDNLLLSVGKSRRSESFEETGIKQQTFAISPSHFGVVGRRFNSEEAIDKFISDVLNSLSNKLERSSILCHCIAFFGVVKRSLRARAGA